MRSTRLTAWCLALLVFPLAGCDRDVPQNVTTKATNPSLGARWQYPREREFNGRTVIVYAPQIRSWDEFRHFTAQVAVEFPGANEHARYAVIELSGDTVLDRATRIVSVPKPKVDRVTFSGGRGTEEHETRVRKAVEAEPLEMPLDVFLYYLADGVLESPPPAGFNQEPPPIFVVESPAFLLFVNGDTVKTAIGDTGIELISNANFPLFRDTKSGAYYLLSGDHRYSAAKLDGPWSATAELPPSFARIPSEGEFATLAKVAAAPPKPGAAPRVITTFRPAEIVVIDGQPRGREIAGTGGLESIANTDSPLFRLDGTYYLLIAGRWFSTKDLQRGPWTFTMPLPDAFARIPGNDDAADVRASVPGTLEARRAVLEAQLPQSKTVKAGAAPAVVVAYAGGTPKFEPIPQTQVARAVNTGNDIIQYGNKYYLCYEGMWYVADKPTGPWAATADVPAAVYQIPPSSPAYPVTQVIVVTNEDGDVESEYDGAYAAGMFFAFGVAYYGTGWYYPPYYYGGYYYPYYGGSYGHGSWYNPNTGGFGSRSVYYGPYGGYTYNQGYNPKTGRSSYLETAWDGDEWASSGGTYNPRTGISTDTDRYYNEDSNKMQTDRTVQGPGGREMDVQKTTDFDTGTRTTERTTSAGGKSDVTRQRQAGGGFTTEGTVKSGDGRTATISGEHQRGQGSTTIQGSEGGSGQIDRERNSSGSVSREGSFSKDGQTIDTETRRDGRQSITKAEGSGGGQAVSIKDGPGDRTTIAQGGSGDIYAGHDGNVYRKTEDGWQQHGNDGWSDVDVPERPGDGTGGIGQGERAAGSGEDGFSREQFEASSRDVARDRAGEQVGAGAGEPRYGGSGSLESRSAAGDRAGTGSSGTGSPSQRSNYSYEQLNRDAAARNGGYQSYERRTSSSSRSMNRGGGGFRPRRR